MDVSGIMNAVGTVGFPIVVALLAMWIIYKQNERHAAQIDAITKTHHDEINTLANKHAEETQIMTTALNANTVAIAKLVTILSGGADNE